MKSGTAYLFVCLLLTACTVRQGPLTPVSSVAPTFTPVASIAPTDPAPTSSASVEPSRAPLPTSNLPQRIAFTSDRDGDKNIYVMEVDGTNQHRLTDDASGDWSPAWSLDGRLAFYSGRDGNIEVYVMNGDGSDQHNVSQHPGRDSWPYNEQPPSWSPDGRLAFYSNRDEGRYEIYVVEADGSGLQELDVCGMSPVWSPDGRSILFACPGSTLWEICIMSADGLNRRSLTTLNLDHNQWWKQFSLSPDGRSIAISHSYTDDNYEVYIMDVDGSNWRRLTENPASDVHPTWSPDGRSIAFASNRSGNFEIYVVDVDGSNLRNLTQHPADDTTPAWSP
jgi:Tol biopolymer transport system component